MPNFPIVDSHVHLYDPGLLPFSWMKGSPILDKRFDLRSFDEHRGDVVVDKIVFAEVAVDPGHHVQEACWVQSLADADPRLVGMVAHLPLQNGAAVEEDLQIMLRLGTLRGIRRLIQEEPDPNFCLQPGFIEGCRRVGAAGLVVDLCIKHNRGQTASITELVRRCPEVTFVLDHIGKPDIKAGAIASWRAELKTLAALPNIVCKVSGVITEADHASWTKEQIRPCVEHAISTFGFDRVMYGSDWTVGLLTHPYPVWVEMLDEILAGASADELHKFWRGTAERVYRI